MTRRFAFIPLLSLLILTAILPAAVSAQTEEMTLMTAPSPAALDLASALEHLQTNLNFVWTLTAACLVFLMQAGFAMVETGFTRAKNAVNIMMKNLMDFSVGTLVFWLFGFGLMFGVNPTGFFGTTGLALNGLTDDPWNIVFWMFQVVFAATAATIVSGAVAERIKFSAYFIYSIIIVGVIYPIFGSWAWGGLLHGGGWLEDFSWLGPQFAGMFFNDFAGSTVVHSVGGWAALAGTIVLGPRLGKFDKMGRPIPIPGHSLPLAALGVFLLWFGWFGFNAGSTTAGDASIAMIAVVTNIAAAAGAVSAMITIWIKAGKPDIGMSLNGALAGLVGITAGCANTTPFAAFLIGTIAGVIVVSAVFFFEKLGIDDPVGAISVHGVCGAWGTFAAGLFDMEGGILSGSFNPHLLVPQIIGMAACFFFVFPTMFVVFKAIKHTIGLRVTPEEEMEGLDLGEHGAEAYPDFTPSTSRMF